jgi:hypothetical protein
VRLRAADGRVVHVGYCFNVLPGETVAALEEQIERFCLPLRQALGVERMGLGLWIAHGAARALAGDPDRLAGLRRRLEEAGLYVFTLNGFPYGGFHAPRVKEQVFLPSWAEAERLAYTIDLAQVLAGLLPGADEVEEGTISTVPLGPASVDRTVAAENLVAAAAALDVIAAATGREIRLCLEPEPGAAIERLEDVAGLIGDLADASGAADESQGGDASAGEWLAARLGACFDTCHAAVVGEGAEEAWRALDGRGVAVGKMQLSSALVVQDPEDPAQRALLAGFDEPRFLHQVRCDRGGAMDVPDALSGKADGSAAALDRGVPWRVHFHVPVHREGFGLLGTTAAAIVPAVEAALARPGRLPHLEVETYTWNVLPEAERPVDDAGLVAGLARELRWTLERLAELGVKPT